MLDPNISLVKLDDEESSLKWCEWWLGYGQENVSLVFEIGGGFKDRMLFKVFLLSISWEDKSKVLLHPDVFFNDSGDLNLGSASYFW